nr:endolytic transglycosylase MltG [Marinicella rhabdoformis]
MIQSVLVVVVLALAALYLFYNRYNNFLLSPVFHQVPVTLDIKKGSNYTDFISLLKSKGGKGELWQWKLLARLNPDQSQIKAGEFEIVKRSTPRELLAYIDGNNVKSYQYTLIEGLTWKTIKSELFEAPMKHVLIDMSDEQLMSKLSIDAPSLEGQFLPETYQFVKGDSDLSVMKRSHQALKEVLADAWSSRSEKVKLKTPYELLILASIIEKETAVASERTTISGVFHRRLLKGMKLQTDPTVIYGVGEDYAGDITRAHLKTDTPYNTYTRKGLPPTPIAMASEASIRAAAQPKDGKALYFVANGLGGHTFSNTYDEHLKAVKKYLRAQRNKP